ncbi:MAG TPA: hypothetical protein VGC37_00970 [Friedmanniella sp.]
MLAATGAAAALVVAAVTGWYPYAKLTPGAPAATIGPGASAELAGVRYQLERFVVAGSLPAEDPKDPPVQGPPGSAVVLVVVNQTVLDRSVRLDDHFCDTTLVDDAGTTVWQTDSDFTTLAARPAAYGCGGSSDSPLAYDAPLQMGFTFVVPADAVGHLSARLQVVDGPTLALRP